MKMYFLVYHVKPTADLPDSNDIAGAYVSCWIESNSIKQSKTIAKQKIVANGWIVLEIDEAYEIGSDHYLEDSEGLEFYEQALIDKWVLRFHTYPIE